MNKKEIDLIIKNNIKGSLITIGGRPAMGKRTFSLNLIEHFCTEGKKCLYMTDYDKRIITETLLRFVANLDKRETLEIQLEKFTQSIKKLKRWNLFIDSKEICTERNIEQNIKEHQPDYLFIDMEYLNMDRLKPVKLKRISEQNNLITFVIADTRKEPQYAIDYYPKITDLREKNLVKYSDLVLLLYRESYYTCDIPDYRKDIIEIIQAKPENNSVKLKFNQKTRRIGT